MNDASSQLLYWYELSDCVWSPTLEDCQSIISLMIKLLKKYPQIFTFSSPCAQTTFVRKRGILRSFVCLIRQQLNYFFSARILALTAMGLVLMLSVNNYIQSNDVVAAGNMFDCRPSELFLCWL